MRSGRVETRGLCGTTDGVTLVNCDHLLRSAEGSQFVEEASAGNCKRTWVNYGQKRDWFDQLQVRGPAGFFSPSFFSSFFLLLFPYQPKRRFVPYQCAQGAGEEFLYHSVECKNIWLPMGTIFAN